MTAIWEASNQNRPLTHVLVVGVDEYLHLKQGHGKHAREHFNLGQLDSPVPSALAFVKWLLGDAQYGGPLCNPAAELGSIELLLAPARKSSQESSRKFSHTSTVCPEFNVPEQNVDLANGAKVAEAWERWQSRFVAGRDDVAIMYFAGHGVRAARNEVLLLQDFGANQKKHWENSINFSETLELMNDCPAPTQVFFIDACRKSVSGWTKINALNLGSAPHGLDVPPTKIAYYATQGEELAHGTSAAPSRFTRILLDALNGGAAERHRPPLGWVIDSDGLAHRLRRLAEWHHDRYYAKSDRQSPTHSEPTHRSTAIHYVQSSPSVFTRILNGKATHSIEVQLTDAAGQIVLPKSVLPVLAQLPLGEYTMHLYNGSQTPTQSPTSIRLPSVCQQYL